MYSSYCDVCRQPMFRCREKDIRLRKRYDTRNNKIYHDQKPMRSMRAFLYKLGAYDPKTNALYQVCEEIAFNRRKVLDTYMCLPLCVWETPFEKEILRHNRADQLWYNVRELPMPKQYLSQLLNILLGTRPNDDD